MFKLLVILFVIKLYARKDIFKYIISLRILFLPFSEIVNSIEANLQKFTAFTNVLL